MLIFSVVYIYDHSLYCYMLCFNIKLDYSFTLYYFHLGPHKPGSTRRMIGSPRQLENAVPTSKNPHGVWV